MWVEEGGVITTQPMDTQKFSLNGIVQDGKLTLKQQFEGDLEAEFDGVFESNTLVKGAYKSNKEDEYEASGQFEFTVKNA